MGTDSDTISGWFVLNAGFKVYGRCPQCHSTHISFYKERRTGLKGISHLSKGLTPVCLDCGKNLPTQNNSQQKPVALKKNTSAIKTGNS
jgi:hypothetical protein